MSAARKQAKGSGGESSTKELSSRRDMLEELFQDSYEHRTKLYRMNFFRGIAFGFGSALGGTVLLALVLWILNLFVDFPYIGTMIKEFLEKAVQ